MSLFERIVAATASVPFAVFGGPIIYRPALGDPFTVNPISVIRSPDQTEPAGLFEGLLVRDSEFIAPPKNGDTVVMAGANYVVSDIQNPNPVEGTRVLVLNRRFIINP